MREILSCAAIAGGVLRRTRETTIVEDQVAVLVEPDPSGFVRIVERALGGMGWKLGVIALSRSEAEAIVGELTRQLAGTEEVTAGSQP